MGSTFFSIPIKRAMPDTVHSSNGPSKRSKPPSATLHTPPGHVAFRLLCHVSRVGGIIGKSGSIIKHLQQSTGTRIRIEDAPAESPDRVITIIGPNSLDTRITLYLGGDDGDGSRVEEIEVSRAQEALVKVFERILEVAAESNGAALGMVSCRLLAEAKQAGGVIGKGGKVVEKIREDTGTKIRILTDKLPACASATEEIVEIEGSVLSVKRALVAVSYRLQDCPPVNKTRSYGGTSSREFSWTYGGGPSGPIAQIDHLSRRRLLVPSIPSGSTSYATRGHPLSLKSENASALDMKTLQQEVVFKILCLNDRVGGVIGKGGATIKALQSDSGATVAIGATFTDCDERLVTVTASENPESQYSPAQKAVVLVFVRAYEVSIEKGLDSGSGKGSNVTARLVVPSSQVGCLLGKGGTTISEMRKVTGTSIWILGTDQVPKCVSENDQVIQILGGYMNVKDALYHVTGKLRDNLFSTSLKTAGAKSSSSVLIESSPYERLLDNSPLELQASSGFSHSLNRNTSLVMDSTNPFGHSYSSDRPRSAGLWTSEMATGLSPRGITDSGRGLSSFRGGLELGSGNRSAIVTNTTVEIRVPENVIDSVYGENGRNLARLREISGAKVIVHEPQIGTSDRIVVISGTPDQTQAAQSLLQAFILTGPSR
ncbi:hypothetical protein V6N11_072508 [Hibiscus sabdariffa]|uniref:K Homology domain-containing protein n=1 Tax=Hibiscus sabdariffa TaxID=183260 RepID=A0ABR2U3I0_9ROSI